jgi:outer membrane scaffolding protein for murein synthesis (MipA/OmpV family)
MKRRVTIVSAMENKKPAILAALAFGVFAAFAHTAQAEQRPLWELGAGGAVVSFPDYRGSDKQRSYVLPIPYVVYRGDVLQVDRDKVRGLLFKTERVELDVSVNGSVPVRSGDNPARQGMPDLDPTLELGPSLNVLLVQDPRYNIALKIPVRAVIASDFRSVHSAGYLAHPQFNLDVRAGQGWKLGFVAGPLFGDRRYHDYFYGVAPQYTSPGRAAYTAHGGYSGAQFIAAASKRFDKLWVGAFIKFDNISGSSFDDSPLVARRNNVAAGLGVSWIFAQSKRLVEARE